MKTIYRKTLFWATIAIVPIGISIFTLSAFNPTNVAETSSEHKDEKLRTRRYNFSGDLSAMKKAIEEAIPTLKTSIWGGNWRVVVKGLEDENDELKVIKAEIPVVMFTDDMRIELKRDNEEVIVNVRSNSRTGKSDLGENRRHILQILEKLDEEFSRI
ncbi:MAG: DUF1499 domain-containing protein [Pyrinomonadaceae bacterium]|nr:DUF1499 domain-containing protein [Pyrinomonadaceae bacterium]